MDAAVALRRGVGVRRGRHDVGDEGRRALLPRTLAPASHWVLSAMEPLTVVHR